MSADHDMDLSMDWCRRCGHSRFEIIDFHIDQCIGIPGVELHPRFLEAQANARRLFDPIVDAVTERLK